jgi:ABC-2 type transport system permease protein
VITACIMQIIYDLDFRALFRRPLEILASAAIVTLIFLAFLFDVTGFDRFVPDPEKVQDAALYCMNTDTAYVSDDGHYEGNDSFPRKYMRLTNIEDVTAIAEYGQKYTRLQKSKSGFPGSGQTPDDKGGTAGDVPGTENTFWNFEVLYRMKNGKTISRQFSVPSSADPAMMDAVTGTQAFREGTFSICHDDIAYSFFSYGIAPAVLIVCILDRYH